MRQLLQKLLNQTLAVRQVNQQVTRTRQKHICKIKHFTNEVVVVEKNYKGTVHLCVLLVKMVIVGNKNLVVLTVNVAHC